MKNYIMSRVNIKKNGCWEWQRALTKSGYGVASVNRKYIRAHRLAYLAFIGEIPFGKLVCHKCDNTKCCNPDHLFLGTNYENTQDMIKKGRRKIGHKFPRKHSNKTIKKCFDLWKSGNSIIEISKKTKVHFTTVYYLIKKHSKKILGDDYVFESKKIGPRFKNHDRAKVCKVISLRKNGKTYRQICLATGISYGAVVYMCKHPERIEDKAL